MYIFPIPPDLTQDQKAALDGYFHNRERLFYGTSIENAIESLRRINTQRQNGECEKADESEVAWFEILHYTKPAQSAT